MEDNVSNRKTSISIDWRIVSVVLVLIIGVMCAFWKPWEGSSASSDRTVQVTGEATVLAEPDEYVFYPSYQFDSEDKEQALSEATKKSDEVIAKLKELGVEDKHIKTSANSRDFQYYPVQEDGKTTYILQITITAKSRETAQTIQDYLVTTTPGGQVSPQATFSDDKKKELESTARDEATKDARARAEQSAKNLGFKVGKVKTVTDGPGFSSVPYEGLSVMTLDAIEPSSSLNVQPGENELSYSVTVVYFVK